VYRLAIWAPATNSNYFLALILANRHAANAARGAAATEIHEFRARIRAVVSIQVFSNFLKRCIKALAKHNEIAILLDERVSAEIVLVDRT
jgi:hypothetical protein